MNMRRNLIGFAAACIVFCASVTATYLSLRIVKPQALQKPTIYDVEYSVLEANPQKYVGKMVRVKVLVFGGPQTRTLTRTILPTYFCGLASRTEYSTS